MHRLALRLVPLLALIASHATAAQQAPADNATKDPAATLREWLRETAATGPTAFEVRWHGGVKLAEPKVATGTFAPDLLLVQTQGEPAQTWLQAGRHSLLREKDGAWQFTKAIAEGIDPPLLLRSLAAELTTIAARSIVERDGAAFEQVTLCLTAAQAERLVNAGAIAELTQVRNARAMVKTGRIGESDVPVPAVDVCLDVDVATHRIRRIHVRAMTATLDMTKLMRNPPGRRAAGAENAEEPVKEAPTPAVEPLTYKDGLPVRDEKGKQVVWLEMVLRSHGEAEPVVLDQEQRAVLGR